MNVYLPGDLDGLVFLEVEDNISTILASWLNPYVKSKHKYKSPIQCQMATHFRKTHLFRIVVQTWSYFLVLLKIK